MRRVLVGIFAIALVLSACGSDPAPEPSSDRAGTTSATTEADGSAQPNDAPQPNDAVEPDGTGDDVGADVESPRLTQVSGTALPPFEQLEDDPAVGRTSPEVVGTDLLTGEAVRIESQGRPMVVVFYAHWCPHCQAEVDEITEWLETNELPAGVDFAAVSVLEDPTRGNHPPATWLAEKGWRHPVVADTPSMDVVGAFGLQSVPFLVAVTSENAVALRYAGNLGTDQLVGLFEFLLEPTA